MTEDDLLVVSDRKNDTSIKNSRVMEHEWNISSISILFELIENIRHELL